MEFGYEIVAFHTRFINVTVGLESNEKHGMCEQWPCVFVLSCLQSSYFAFINHKVFLTHPHVCKKALQVYLCVKTGIIFKSRVISGEVGYSFTPWLVLADQQNAVIRTVCCTQ